MTQWRRRISLLTLLMLGHLVQSTIAQELSMFEASVLKNVNIVTFFSEASVEPFEMTPMPSALTATAFSTPQSLTPTLLHNPVGLTATSESVIVIPSFPVQPPLPPIVEPMTVSPQITDDAPPLTEVQTPPIAPIILTAEPTETEIHFITSSVCGRVDLSYATQQATLTMSDSVVTHTITTQNDGAFCVDVPSGTYQFTFHAPQHLPSVLEVTITDQPLFIPDIQLINGDVNNDGFINMVDVNLVIENFDLAVPPAMPAADLNGDNQVNISDLTIVSAHIQSDP